TNRRRDKSLHH
ncbi:unnamed protein product, partial [Allacma fusca]